MLQMKLIIYWHEFLPLLQILSIPTAVSSKNVLTIEATSCLYVTIFLKVHMIKRLATIKRQKTIGQPRFCCDDVISMDYA